MKNPIIAQTVQILSGVAFVVAPVALAFLFAPPSHNTDPLRLQNQEVWASLKPTQHQHGKREGKGSNPVAIRSLIDPDLTIEVGVPFTLKARIQAQRDFTNLEWSWTLPESVQVISGESQSIRGSVFANEHFDMEITLVSHQPDPVLIHLHAFEMRDQQAYGNVTQFVAQSFKRAPATSAEEQVVKPLTSEVPPILQ